MPTADVIDGEIRVTSPPFNPNDPATWPITMTVQQVSVILGMNQNEMYQRFSRGDVAFVTRKVGARWIVPREPFIAWLHGTTEPTSNPAA